MLWPSSFDIASAMMREETSDAPPAAKGTISVMLRSGQVWAEGAAIGKPADHRAAASPSRLSQAALGRPVRKMRAR